MRELRERQRAGANVITLTLSRTATDLLIAGGWLEPQHRSNRERVGDALVDLLLPAFEMIQQGRWWSGADECRVRTLRR